jgi:hypothetical protein
MAGARTQFRVTFLSLDLADLALGPSEIENADIANLNGRCIVPDSWNAVRKADWSGPLPGLCVA